MTDKLAKCVSIKDNTEGYKLLLRAYDAYFPKNNKKDDFDAGNAIMLTFMDFVVDVVNDQDNRCEDIVKVTITDASKTIKGFLAKPNWEDVAWKHYKKWKQAINGQWTTNENSWNTGYTGGAGQAIGVTVKLLMEYKYKPSYKAIL